MNSYVYRNLKRKAIPFLKQIHYRASFGYRVPTIVSDDCWGGEFYREYTLKYTTPFVGLFVEPESYLELVENFHEVVNRPLEFADSPRPFPVARLGGVIINFMHYKSRDEAAQSWLRRRSRINFKDLYFKVDFSPRSPFGSVDYSQEDIDCWNRIATSRHIALVNSIELLERVRNSIYVENWEIDAVKNYHKMRNTVSILKWLRI
jgi:hypothetical protein